MGPCLSSLLLKDESAATFPRAPEGPLQPEHPSSTQPFIIIIQFIKYPLFTLLNPVSLPLFTEAVLKAIVWNPCS